MSDALLILLVAYLLDLLIGDPVYPLHPVRLIGSSILIIQNIFKKITFFNIAAGGLLTIIVILFSNIIYLLIEKLSDPYAYLVQVFLVYSLIAGKDLIKHTEVVIRELIGEHIDEARYAVSMIVGRDPAHLNSEGISKAAIESVAE
ncbi:MAG: hypothetical protein HOC24_08550, partial [Deltaproteobacteria bacterium]|nr:hypothetical protein [Deltaproteobacteria bacterium]